MNRNLPVGTKVVRVETWKGHTFKKFGEVVEIGAGSNDGRLRVRWSHSEGTNGSFRKDGKRTWVKAETVQVVVTDVSTSIDVLDENFAPLCIG